MTIIDGFKSFAMDAFSGVARGFGGMLQAFLNGGKMSGAAFASMAKAVAAGLAAQSLVEAAMQVAHAIKQKALAAASLAIGDLRGAGLHTAAAAGHIAAAKAFGIVGGVAAAAALAIPGGGAGGAAGNTTAGGVSNRDRGGVDRDRATVVDVTRRQSAPAQKIQLTMNLALPDGTIVGRKETIIDAWTHRTTTTTGACGRCCDARMRIKAEGR